MPGRAGDGDADGPPIVRLKKTSPKDPGLAPVGDIGQSLEGKPARIVHISSRPRR